MGKTDDLIKEMQQMTEADFTIKPELPEAENPPEDTAQFDIENLIPKIMEEMSSDADNESEALYAFYQNASPEEKKVIDNVLMYLCGWTMETLISKIAGGVDESSSEDKKVQRQSEKDQEAHYGKKQIQDIDPNSKCHCGYCPKCLGVAKK